MITKPTFGIGNTHCRRTKTELRSTPVIVALALSVLALAPPRTRADLTWQSALSFPVAAYQYDPVEHNGYIYVVGGYGGQALSNAYYAKVLSDGSLESWAPTTPLPVADQAPGVTIYGDAIYAHLPGSALLYRAPIGPDGGLGSWIPESAPTTQPGYGCRLNTRAHDGYLYVLGGYRNGSFFANVYFAQIHPDGSLGSWSQTTPMPQPRQHESVHFFGGRVYIVGGISSCNTILDSAYSAPVNADGTVGTWRPEASLPTKLWQHSSVMVGGDILLLGGFSNYSGSLLVTNILRGFINRTDGTIAQWTVVGQIPLAMSSPGAAYCPSNDTMYLVGGWNPVTEFTSNVWRGDYTASGSITLDAQMGCGLTITGPIGYYQIEYLADVSNTNDWITLTNLNILSTPYLFFDPYPVGQKKRYYRAVMIR